MKFKLVEEFEELDEERLNEATLSSIENYIHSVLPTCAFSTTVKPGSIVITTPANFQYSIPIETLSVKGSKDYKKLRYKGNGTVTNGILTDPSGATYPCYIGVSTNHNHYEFNPDVKVYELVKGGTGSSMPFSTFASGVNAGYY